MDDLNKKELSKLHGLLKSRKVELEELLSMSAESSKTVELDQPIGRLSRMDAIQQQKMAQANRANYERTLRKVDLALAAIEEGSYGDCQSCGECIGFARLKAQPESLMCIECKGAVEQNS